MVRRDIDCLSRFNGAVYIRLADFSVFDFNYTLGIQASNMVAGDARSNVGNFGICHQFSFINCLSDGLCSRINIGHHACFQAARRRLPQTDDVNFVILLDLSDKCDNF